MKSILMTAVNVRAILDGRKTQTRRLVRFNSAHRVQIGRKQWHIDDPNCIAAAKFKVGKTIYVKEGYCSGRGLKLLLPGDGITATGCNAPDVIYRADEIYTLPNGLKWSNAMFMPEKYARLFITITGVRAERLGEISEADAIAEGIQKNGNAIPEYIDLWNSIHGAKAWDNDKNKYVWVYTFERKHQ